MRLRLIITNTLADHLIQSELVVDMRAYLKELHGRPTCYLSVFGTVGDAYILSDNDDEKPAEDSLAKEMMLIPSVEARVLYINK